MNQEHAESLAQQGEDLRRKMTAQRLIVALNLGPSTSLPVDFPRSVTMQLLLKRPDLWLRLLAPLIQLVSKARLLKSMPLLMLLVIVVRRVAQQGDQQQRVEYRTTSIKGFKKDFARPPGRQGQEYDSSQRSTYDYDDQRDFKR